MEKQNNIFELKFKVKKCKNKKIKMLINEMEESSANWSEIPAPITRRLDDEFYTLEYIEDYVDKLRIARNIRKIEDNPTKYNLFTKISEYENTSGVEFFINRGTVDENTVYYEIDDSHQDYIIYDLLDMSKYSDISIIHTKKNMEIILDSTKQFASMGIKSYKIESDEDLYINCVNSAFTNIKIKVYKKDNYEFSLRCITLKNYERLPLVRKTKNKHNLCFICGLIELE